MFELYNVAVIPLIIGVVEMFKKAGLPVRFSPFVAVTFGIILGVYFIANDVREGIIIGIMYGLSASGLYSGTKNMVEKGNGR